MITKGSKVWVRYQHASYNTYATRCDWTIRRVHSNGTYDVTNRRSERINQIDPEYVTCQRGVMLGWQTTEREEDDRARDAARAHGAY
jgi:hypothetical protein